MTDIKPFAFTDRDSYLAWRAAWKAAYKALSLEIRQAKIYRKETQRLPGMVLREGEDWRGYQARLLAALPEKVRPYANTRPLYHTRPLATAMLEQLKAAKIEAQRQYLAAHAPVPING